ncbi:MAG: glycosyltransferase [Candidatus Aenigmarchaeota archaeon]|nr:glycosyltransferase [Candidatus Aenigmarchaeota archaeon]
MEKVRFSFIIPALNEEQYIGDCLASIKRQKRKDYEIIVVDGCSKDATAALAKRRGAVVVHEREKGPGAARNAGVRKARGSVLIFIDADVRVGNNFLDAVESRLGTGIGGFICRLYSYDGFSSLYTLAHVIMKLLFKLRIAMTAGSCFIYRKDVFERAGGFDPLLMTNEDHDLAIRASKLMRFMYFDDIHVMTSSRRVRKMGFLGALKIYIKSTFAYFLNGTHIRGYWDYDS